MSHAAGHDRYEMVPPLDRGRTFVGSRRVRLGDVDPSGRLRLDALNRYTQDVSNDDTTDAGLTDDTAWVVRRTHVEIHRHAELAETLELTTFCGAIGRRWADRRITVTGSRGAHYEVATLWIHLDLTNGRPLALSQQFLDLYGLAAGDRTVTAKQTLPKLPASVEAGAALDRRGWPSRAVDFDTQRHMNNAAYWAVFEQLIAERPFGGETCPAALRATIEYGSGISLDAEVELAVAMDASPATSVQVWWLANADQVAASGALSLPVAD